MRRKLRLFAMCQNLRITHVNRCCSAAGSLTYRVSALFRGLALEAGFLPRSRFERPALEEEIEVAAHDQVRGECQLKRGTFSIDQELVKQPEGHNALRTRPLVNGGSY